MRLYDIIVTTPGRELVPGFNTTLTNPRNIYNPSDLGGGFQRNEDGSLSAVLNSVSFQMIFKTDAESTGYEKYMKTTEDAASGSLVWLRYAVPVGNDYKYAYRPGYIASISKTEGHYEQASLVETLTIQTVGGWFDLCTFTQAEAETSLKYTPQRKKLFSVYPDNFKKPPYVFPYWYKSAVESVMKRSGTWQNRFGDVLDSGSQVFQVFAVHAPSFTISPDEMAGLNLTEQNAPAVAVQTNRQKAQNFQTKNIDPKVEGELRSKYSKMSDSFGQFKNKRRGLNFKASLANYSNTTHSGPFAEWHSYQIVGNATAGGRLTFSSSAGVSMSELKFLSNGEFTIDTAPWANIYSLNRGSSEIDFSKFTKTTVSQGDTLKASGVTFSKIILRREILSV